MRRNNRRRWLAAALAMLATAGCFATPQPAAAPAAKPLAAATRHLLMVGAVPGPTAGQTLSTPLRWNVAVTDYLATHASSPPAAARALALVHLAIFDALLNAPVDATVQDAAIARAAYGVLAYLYPQDANNLYTMAVNLFGRANSPLAQQGVLIGARYASQVITFAQGDGAGYTPAPLSAVAGLWNGPTAVGNGAGGWRPWLMDATANYTPVAPPAPGTPMFQAQLASLETSAAGATAVQQAAALRWAKNLPPLDTQPMADAVLARHALTPLEDAGVLAWLNMVLADVAIASWQSKYQYRLERPQQADPRFVAFLAAPSYPAYPSAQAAFATAAATFLTGLFPDESVTLAAQAAEAGNSRLYGGIAYPLDVQNGDSLGTRIAQLGLRLANQQNWHYTPVHPNPVPTPSPVPVATPTPGSGYVPVPGVPVPPWPLPTDTAAAIQAAGLPLLTNMAQVAYHIHIHLDVFYNGKPVTVPADLAIDPNGAFLSALHTHDTSGVIHVESPDISAHLTIGQLFTEWAVPLTGALAYDNGQLMPNAASVVLQNLHEVAIVYGTPPAQIPTTFDWASW